MNESGRKGVHADRAGIDTAATAAVDLQIPDGHVRGERLSFGQRCMYRLFWFVTQIIGRGYFRTRVYGMENVPKGVPFILAPNHRSNLDTPITAIIRWKPMRYMGKESLWKKPAGGWFLTALGGFPVKRGTVDRDALRACIEVIERGEPLVMFPEGTRQSGPELCELFDGPAYVACRTGVPILPMGIGGSEAAMGKGVKLPKPHKMVLVVGTPIQPPPPAEGKTRVSRRAMTELTETLRVEVQALFDEAQRLAGD